MNQDTKELLAIRNKLYNNIPTGQIDAFGLLKLISAHLKELDNFIEHPHPSPSSGVSKEAESIYEKAFKPYCIDYLANDSEDVRKEKIKFAFDNKEDAFKLLESFYNTDYGSINIDENLISIHTGGWSDNEEIIYEFKKTLWWQTYFRMQITGGHYYFDTDRQDGIKEWGIVKKLSNDTQPPGQ